jgi:hypothetical protein
MACEQIHLLDVVQEGALASSSFAHNFRLQNKRDG